MKRPPTAKQLAARALYDQRIKVLTKFLKKLPGSNAEIAREMATVKRLEALGYGVEFMLKHVALGFKLNSCNWFLTGAGKEHLAAAKNLATLPLEDPNPDVYHLQTEKVGEDRKVERKESLSEFLRS